ncbi:hypothetical protein [Mycobacterium intracellulare]|uniref:hypothetical protein n=1 Tax=Mycobacterium intracellulare TaxID=1767 RepID=UPI000CE4C96C|nr:hypothetical protein [Mycobacterium intracellulare]
MADVIVILGVTMGLAVGQLIWFISGYFWRRYRLPVTRAWIETEVLSLDGPIGVTELKYGWRGYRVALQWDDIDRVGIARHWRLTNRLLLKTYVEGVKSGVFIATQPAPEEKVR